LELSELFAGWQNGGAKQSNKQYKAVTVICCDRFLRQCAAPSSTCGNVPLQVPPLMLLQYSLGWRNGGAASRR